MMRYFTILAASAAVSASAALTMAGLTTSALAADMPTRAVKPTPPVAAVEACKETAQSALPIDIFGFSSGSDITDPGSWGASAEYIGAFGARFGTLNNHGVKTQVSASPLPCLEIGPSLNYGFARLSERVGFTNSRVDAYGGQLEFKYKLLGRATHGVGLTITVEPGYSQLRNRFNDPLTPFFGSERSGLASNSFKALLDFAIVPGFLFGAVNVEYAQTWLSAEPLALNGCAPASLSAWCRGSSLNLRAAVSARLADAFYLGVEAQHLRTYNGVLLNRLEGHALFVGPTLFWQATEKLAVSGTVATQVAGKARGVAGNLDLDHYSRHIAKLKIGYSF